MSSNSAPAGASAARRCFICASPLTATFVDLGMSPLCESFLKAEQLDAMEPFYPLHAKVCGDCFLVQLPVYVTPENIFTEYAYFSAYASSWVEHAKRYCSMIAQRLSLGADSFVVEIASNDGYLLQHFIPLGIPMLGIEPAVNVAEAARARGVPTLTEFFGLELAQRLVQTGKQPDLIVGNNVLAQVPDLNDFARGLAHYLAPHGVVTLEFPHLQRLMEGNQFDTIYHEHFSYFSLLSITRLAEQNGLKVIDVEQLPTHGGSLRVYLARAASSWTPTAAVQALLAQERAAGLADLAAYAQFGEQVNATKRALLHFLIAAKQQGKRICGYGAPGKGNTLLNYCGIGPDFLDFTVDRNPYKHGRFTPGMHIPIRPVAALDEAKPDYVLILPWNLKTEIVAQMRHIGDWGGKFIVPIPDVAVIDPREA